MKVQLAQLSAHLNKQLAPVYILSGDEPLQLGEAADVIRAAARKADYANREIMEVDSRFDWNQLMQEANSLSLFADKKIIDMRIPGGKPGREGSKAFSEYCARIPEDTLLLITLPKLDKGQANSKWYKALDQSGVSLQIWPIAPAQLANWVKGRMQQAGLQPAAEVAEMLAERVEGNLLAARQEIEKLLLIYGPGKISIDQLIGMIADSARFDVFTLVDAALQGKSSRCVRILAGLKGEGLAPQIVLWALAREIRSMCSMAANVAQGSSLDQVLNQARVWSNRKALVKNGLSRLRPTQWMGLLTLCQKADAATKGAITEDPWLLFEKITLGMSGVKLS